MDSIAIIASPTPAAREAEAILRAQYEFADFDNADLVIVLGGDGFMLQTLHTMFESRRIRPVFGMNRGTIGFLMNGWLEGDLHARLHRAKRFDVAPLLMQADTADGETVTLPAINEVSLLRETRQAAKIEVLVNGRSAIEELICDGILVATPAGSTAYNLSANGPILPLGSQMLALTPISPFRPRRWKGAILPDSTRVEFVIKEPNKRPVSAVADQREVRDVVRVRVEIDRNRHIPLLFDPEHALDERIAMEQFIT